MQEKVAQYLPSLCTVTQVINIYIFYLLLWNNGEIPICLKVGMWFSCELCLCVCTQSMSHTSLLNFPQPRGKNSWRFFFFLWEFNWPSELEYWDPDPGSEKHIEYLMMLKKKKKVEVWPCCSTTCLWLNPRVTLRKQLTFTSLHFLNLKWRKYQLGVVEIQFTYDTQWDKQFHLAHGKNSIYAALFLNSRFCLHLGYAKNRHDINFPQKHWYLAQMLSSLTISWNQF